jgi:hypothetical protein
VIDVDDIGLRWRRAEAFLDERGRRLLAANEALAHGYGGVSAVAQATGLARSTINRGIRELRLGRNEIGKRGSARWGWAQERRGAPAEFAGSA